MREALKKHDYQLFSKSVNKIVKIFERNQKPKRYRRLVADNGDIPDPLEEEVTGFDVPQSASNKKEVVDEIDLLMDLKNEEGLNVIELSFDILVDT